MSSNYSTCSKSYYPLCSLKCRACSGRCPRSARRFNGGSSERSRCPDLPSMWSGGLSWRRAGRFRFLIQLLCCYRPIFACGCF